MNVVDSSGWLEYFADGPNADFFEPPINEVKQLLVPTLSLYEVFRRVVQLRGEGEALQAIAVMQQGKVIELTSTLVIDSARLALEKGLPMADSIMLATAQTFRATLWTQDTDFKDLDGVRFIEKGS